jgi:hypothetical protein
MRNRELLAEANASLRVAGAEDRVWLVLNSAAMLIVMRRLSWTLPGETESGSAEVQPDKG